MTAAPEVIELAATAGLILDEWQQYVLTHGLGQRAGGDWTAKKVSCWVPRQNGKGAIIEALELAWLFLFDEELVVHSAHEHKTSKKAYMRMEKLIRRTPSMLRRVKTFRQTNGENMIVLRDGRQLEYHTRSNTAVRGFSAPKLVLDEAQELTEDQMAAIQPTVSAMRNWQMWFFGTPPRNADAWAYGLRADGQSRQPRLAHFDWGADLDLAKAEDRAKTADPDLWYDTNPALGIRIELETVQDEYRPSGLGSKFGQERLGIWLPPALTNDIIDFAQWLKLHDEASHREGDISLGVDISVLRDWSAITVWGSRADGLGHGQLVDYRPGTEWLVPRLAELRTALDPLAVGMGRGTHESIKADLATAGLTLPKDPDRPRRGDLLVMNAVDNSAACGQIIDAVRQATFRVVPAQPLDEAVAGAKTRATNDTIAWARRDSDAEISPIASLTAARFTHLTRLFLGRALGAPVTANVAKGDVAGLFRPQQRLKL